MSSIFICHSSEDHDFVVWLVRELKKKGVKVWVDERELLVGNELDKNIRHGISKADYFGIVLTKHSVVSPWVMKELEMAKTRELSEKRTFILGILVEDCNIPSYLENRRYADFRKSDEEGLQSLLERLVGRSHFQCVLVRQRTPATRARGFNRQKIEIKNYSNIKYKNEMISVVVADRIDPNKCFFGLNMKNLTNQTKKDVKIKVKPVDSTKSVVDLSTSPNIQVLSGGVKSNYFSCNIAFLHPNDEIHLGFALNTDEWPEIELLSDSGIWDGRVYRFDVIPREHSWGSYPAQRRKGI